MHSWPPGCWVLWFLHYEWWIWLWSFFQSGSVYYYLAMILERLSIFPFDGTLQLSNMWWMHLTTLWFSFCGLDICPPDSTRIFRVRTSYPTLSESLRQFTVIFVVNGAGPLFKKAVADSNAPCQEKALDALIAYLRAADTDASRHVYLSSLQAVH